jgi:hypothetical protein
VSGQSQRVPDLPVHLSILVLWELCIDLAPFEAVERDL